MNKEITLQTLSDKIDRIAELAAFGSKDLLDVREAADYIGVKPSYIYQLTSSRQIPYYKAPNSKRIHFSKKELTEWMMRMRVKPNDEIAAAAQQYINEHKY